MKDADEEPNILSSLVVGNIGLYWCCYKLSLLGWNVMPTARNARGVDILAYDQNATQFAAIQVKSLSRKVGVPIGPTLDKVMGDWWIVIIGVTSITPTAFVLRPEEVRKRALRREKDGKVSFWLSANEYDADEFREAWRRIGLVL